MSTALLFPGQGSQTAGMRESVAEHEPELLALVLAQVGADPCALAGEGTADAQPAILCASLAAWSGAGRPLAEYFAGHSLGELSALAAAGAIDPADAVRLATVRGRLMQAAGEAAPGGMIALLGDAAEARDAAAASGAVIANDNGPAQLVAAGPPAVLEATAREAKARGVRTIRLAVGGAFHTPAMQPAVEPYRAELERVAFGPPAAPVISSSTAEPFATDAAGIRDQLAAALVRPVRWRETADQLHRLGVRSFVETGPGKALTGMVRRSLDGVETSVLGRASVRG